MRARPNRRRGWWTRRRQIEALERRKERARTRLAALVDEWTDQLWDRVVALYWNPPTEIRGRRA